MDKLQSPVKVISATPSLKVIRLCRTKYFIVQQYLTKLSCAYFCFTTKTYTIYKSIQNSKFHHAIIVL